MHEDPLYKTVIRFSLCSHIKMKIFYSQALRENHTLFVAKPDLNQA